MTISLLSRLIVMYPDVKYKVLEGTECTYISECVGGVAGYFRHRGVSRDFTAVAPVRFASQKNIPTV